ncbi:MAG: UDP-N-acetylmuramoyl-L-alanine--D-glutamate ligase [Brevinematia bacterium]
MILGKKNFLVLGFTHRTGFHTAKFLAEKGCNVLISDKVRDPEKEELLSKVKEKAKGEVIDLLGTEDAELDNVEMIISSPGVPLTNPIIAKALEKDIEVIGDIELFYRLKPNIRYIAITGTDGKTTTTNITHKVLSSYLPKTFIGGNVGIPIFSLFEEDIETLVLEISSFQIDTTREFTPKIGAITNIAKDHLDRYPSFEDYIASKFSLFKNSEEKEISVLNKSLLNLPQVNNLRCRKIFFSAYEGRNGKLSSKEVYLRDGYIWFEEEKVINTTRVKLIGKHNIENIMIAVAIGMEMELPKEIIEESIYSFEPLPHRMEFVTEIDGAKYINDSKSTTINAMVSAIRSLDNPIVLIVGGLDKGMDFDEAVPIIKKKVKYVIAIGSTRELIVEKLKTQGYNKFYKAENLEDAVTKAREIADKGDIVLFSPAYASFDMFKNYEHRGECFKSIVRKLAINSNFH